jgi:hypothetical protein
VGDAAALQLARDPLLLEEYNNGIAKRMDEHPGGDFVFPDLSPEQYAEAKRKMDRKPS